jgi:hypothetical protein
LCQEEYNTQLQYLREKGYDPKQEPRMPEFLIKREDQTIGAFMYAKDMIFVEPHASVDLNMRWQVNSILRAVYDAVEGIKDAFAYNRGNLRANSTPAGVFTINGGPKFTLRNLGLEQFKIMLWNYISTPAQRQRLPVLSLPEGASAQFIPFNISSKDAEYYQWITLLMTIICRAAGADPNEISFASMQNLIEGKTLSRESPEGVRRQSEDEGLRSFLHTFEDAVNQSGIIRQLAGPRGKHWEIEITGLDIVDKLKEEQLKAARLSTTDSLNDQLRAADKEELDKPWAKLPGVANPIIAQFIQMEMQMEMQQQMGGMPGGEEAGGMPGAMPPGGEMPGQEQPLEQPAQADQELVEQYGAPEPLPEGPTQPEPINTGLPEEKSLEKTEKIIIRLEPDNE